MPDFPDEAGFAQAMQASPETSAVQGPVAHPETGMITHFGLHSTKVIHHGGAIETLRHGESFTSAKDGKPAMLLKYLGTKGA